MEEFARRDLIIIESVSFRHGEGSGISKQLPGGTHEEWLFEGLFEELLFNIRVAEGL